MVVRCLLLPNLLSPCISKSWQDLLFLDAKLKVGIDHSWEQSLKKSRKVCVGMEQLISTQL